MQGGAISLFSFENKLLQFYNVFPCVVDCAPYFSYSAASYTYLVVTACSGTYSEASQSCVSLGGSMGALRDENVAAAMTFAAYTEQG